MEKVVKAYNNLPSDTINNIFIFFLACMNCVIKYGEGSEYKLPHINKKKLPRDLLGNIKTIAVAVPILDVEVASNGNSNDESFVFYSDSKEFNTSSMAENEDMVKI